MLGTLYIADRSEQIEFGMGDANGKRLLHDSLTAERKDATFGAFAFARATRFFSVALPALVVGHALERRGARLARAEYQPPYYTPLPLWKLLLRGLSFSNEWAGFETRPGTNGPFWSLSYEIAYDALFGLTFYTTGLRRVALLALGVAVSGLNTMRLMPARLMGVLVCCHLIGVVALLRNTTLERPHRPLAWLTRDSFPIYLMHYPLLHAPHAALPNISHAALFALTVLACLAFAEVFERPLDLWRRGLRSLLRPGQDRVAG